MIASNKWKAAGLLVAAGVAAADQLSKWLVVTRFFADAVPVGFAEWLVQKGAQAHYPPVSLSPFLNMVMVWNPGVSFGLLQTGHKIVSYGLTVMALAVAAGFLVWLWREPRPWRALSVGMVVGGALGNVWDRWRFGAVADFIDVHLGAYHWPAFNIADAGITVGIAMILIETLFFPVHPPVAPRSQI